MLLDAGLSFPKRDVGCLSGWDKMTRATDMPCYQIHVEGVLDPQWSECLAGLDISVREQPGDNLLSRC